MPKSDNQKLKLLYVRDLLLSETDDEHSVSVSDIIAYLEDRGIHAERKSIYNDIDTLIDYGMDIVCERTKQNRYSLASRDFELAELKLLSECVAASRFLSAKKSAQLIKNIQQLASTHEARQLRRQIFVENRIKTQNESIYYNVDAIHRAIAMGKQISFFYSRLSPTKEKIYRHNKQPYVCSPYGLTCSNDNYYLAAYYEKYDKVVPFRTDRMESIKILDDKICSKPFSMADFCKENFSMFVGKTEYATIKFDNSLADVVIDKFGKDTPLQPEGENSFSARVKIAVSPQFTGWLAGLGDKAEILYPEHLRKDYVKSLKKILKLY